MNRKIMFSLVIIVMALSLVIGGTFAWFTAMAEGPENVFTAGTVEIDVDSIEEVVDLNVLNNMNPGDCTEKTFTVVNTGTKDIYLRAKFIAKWDGLKELDDMGNATATLDETYDWLSNYNVSITAVSGSTQFIADPAHPAGEWVIGNYNYTTGVFTPNVNGDIWYTGYFYYLGELNGTYDLQPSDVTTADFTIEVCFDGPLTTNKYQAATFTLTTVFEAIQSSNEASNDLWLVSFENGTWSPVTP